MAHRLSRGSTGHCSPNRSTCSHPADNRRHAGAPSSAALSAELQLELAASAVRCSGASVGYRAAASAVRSWLVQVGSPQCARHVQTCSHWRPEPRVVSTTGRTHRGQGSGVESTGIRRSWCQSAGCRSGGFRNAAGQGERGPCCPRRCAGSGGWPGCSGCDHTADRSPTPCS